MSGVLIAIASGQDPVILQPAPGVLFASDQYNSQIVVTATPDVTWTYSVNSGTGGSVSRASGTIGPSITLSLSTSPAGAAPAKAQEWTLTATLGSFTKSWTVQLQVTGDL